MHRDEQVRLLGPGAAHAVAQGDEVIAVPGEDCLHPWLVVDAQREFPGDCQRHVLLTGPVLADRARIIAAVTGIDGDNDVTSARRRVCGTHRRIHRRRAGQVDHQTIAVMLVGLGEEALRMHRPGKIENDPQLLGGALCHTHLFDAARTRLQAAHATPQPGIGDIHDHAVRVLEDQKVMRCVGRQIEHDPGAFRTNPKPHPAHIGGLRRRSGK